MAKLAGAKPMDSTYGTDVVAGTKAGKRSITLRPQYELNSTYTCPTDGIPPMYSVNSSQETGGGVGGGERAKKERGD
jgi:hypothetical protein